MKFLIFSLLIFLNLVTQGQLRVTTTEPSIAIENRQYLFRNFDNPISINSGVSGNVTITISSGILKKGDQPGKFFLRPDSSKSETQITLVSTQGTKTYTYIHRYIPTPKIYFDPISDNPHPYMTRGLLALHHDFDYDLLFTVDSFTIARQDSIHKIEHRNYGALYDEVTLKWIREAPSGTTFIIKDIYVGREGRKFEVYDELPIYIPTKQ